MHIEKYGSKAVKNMINHYERGSESVLNRENIDRNRTPLNWTINRTHDLHREIKTAVEKIQNENNRKLRKDANWMASVVLTKPENVKEEHLERFFKSSAQFIFNELRKNGLDEKAPRQAYIHMDETTPHMHLSFCPIYTKDGKRTFNFCKIFPRKFYKTIHKDLQRHLTPILGYSPAVLLEGDNKLKSLNKMDIRTFQRTKDEMKRQKNEIKKEIDTAKNQLNEVLDEKKVLNGESTLSEKENEQLAQQIEDFWRDYNMWEQKLEQLNNKYEKLMKQSYWVRKNTARDLLKEERELMLQGKNWNTVIYDIENKQKKKQKRKNMKRKLKSLLR